MSKKLTSKTEKTLISSGDMYYSIININHLIH